MEKQSTKQTSRKHYDNTGIGGADTTAYQLALSFVKNGDLKDKVIINVGCGLGILDAILYKSSRPKQYVGIDFSPLLAKKAKTRSSGFDFVVADAENLPIRSEIVDFVFSTEAIEHFPNFRAAFREFNRVLRNGSACLVTTPNYDSMLKLYKIVFEWSSGVNYTMGQVVEHHFTASGLRKELMDAGFCNIEFRGINFRGNMGIFKIALASFVGGFLRKAGVLQRISIKKQKESWRPPIWAIDKGVKPYYNKFVGRFGLSLGLRALKSDL
jgi:ubiquinone/menaquinone biosynthesis C-methylase UbiE